MSFTHTVQLGGQRSNPEAQVDALTDLLFEPEALVLRRRVLRATDFLDTSVVLPSPRPVKRRLGWAVPLVLVSLARLGGPVGPAAVVADIREHVGEELAVATVTHVLRRSQQAKAGQILRVGRGMYVLGQGDSEGRS